MERWCKDADRWNSMYSEETCPSATLSTSNSNSLGTREILAVRITAWAKERPNFYKRKYQLCKYDVKYGLQSDTWYTVCAMIIVCELLYRTWFKVCLQFWDRGCVSTRWSSCIVWGICHTVVEQDNSIISVRFMGFGHWTPCATASVMYLKKQRSQTICCVMFQTYCLTRNQIIGALFTNLVSL